MSGTRTAPWSVIMLTGVPNCVTQLERKWDAVPSAVMYGIGIAVPQRVTLSSQTCTVWNRWVGVGMVCRGAHVCLYTFLR